MRGSVNRGNNPSQFVVAFAPAWVAWRWTVSARTPPLFRALFATAVGQKGCWPSSRRSTRRGAESREFSTRQPSNDGRGHGRCNQPALRWLRHLQGMEKWCSKSCGRLCGSDLAPQRRDYSCPLEAHDFRRRLHCGDAPLPCPFLDGSGADLETFRQLISSD